MAKQLLLFPTFDGQTKGTAAINPEAIDLIKPAVMPGMTNISLRGNHGNNTIGVFYDFGKLLEVLEKSGYVFIDLGGSKATPARGESSEGH